MQRCFRLGGVSVQRPSVHDAASLVYIRQGGNSHIKPAVIEQLRRSAVFEDVAGENEETYINYNDGVETRPIFALQATKNYLRRSAFRSRKGAVGRRRMRIRWRS